MDVVELFLADPGADRNCPNFGQGYRPDPFCPEFRMREVLQFSQFWQEAGARDPTYANEIPYWAIVWPGSRMLARHILDHLQIAGKRVLELGSGSGLASIAAASKGATVLATDHSQDAIAIAEASAAKNGQSIETAVLDLSEPATILMDWKPDLVLLGDVFYEKHLADLARRWILEMQQLGIDSLIADPYRNYGPARDSNYWNLELIASYDVPVRKEIENIGSRRTALLRSRGFAV